MPTGGNRLPIDGRGDFGASPFFGQLSGKQKTLECARTLHCFSIDGYVRLGSWLCKNAVLREVGEKLGLVQSQATIAAINGLIPTMFMTRVRL